MNFSYWSRGNDNDTAVETQPAVPSDTTRVSGASSGVSSDAENHTFDQNGEVQAADHQPQQTQQQQQHQGAFSLLRFLAPFSSVPAASNNNSGAIYNFNSRNESRNINSSNRSGSESLSQANRNASEILAPSLNPTFSFSASSSTHSRANSSGRSSTSLPNVKNISSGTSYRNSSEISSKAAGNTALDCSKIDEAVVSTTATSAETSPVDPHVAGEPRRTGGSSIGSFNTSAHEHFDAPRSTRSTTVNIDSGNGIGNISQHQNSRGSNAPPSAQPAAAALASRLFPNFHQKGSSAPSHQPATAPKRNLPSAYTSFSDTGSGAADCYLLNTLSSSTDLPLSIVTNAATKTSTGTQPQPQHQSRSRSQLLSQRQPPPHAAADENANASANANAAAASRGNEGPTTFHNHDIDEASGYQANSLHASNDQFPIISDISWSQIIRRINYN
ncbi:hypothetical protein AYI70_g6886 [Smittium culicis]|uniref:Uncharacterized protein n=1 Tax=Smittium culicis TaxID=133412 RepID=A0A1R1XN05_9FUNG|nr:hypothetical protein AYI70_g6886 [Smittium culicis]